MPARADAGRRADVVMTVTGPVDPAHLGVTLSHDHVLIDAWEMLRSYSVILDDEQVATEELRRFKAAGGSAICDPTPMDLGRDPEALRRISEAAGVHLVMGAGWYRPATYPSYIDREGPGQLAERLIRELTDGVGSTGIRPGFIGEIGTERHFVAPAVERVFRAAGRAHAATGCPVLTHTTHSGELAMQQLDLLEEEGTDPASVIISHLGDRRGIERLIPVARRGAWLSVDNLGFVAGYAPLEVRARNVAALWEAGFGSRVLLSNDICTQEQLASNGGCGYANVLTNFVPLLRTHGLTDREVRAMTVDNPARAFAYPA
jgi:predicted metal-dependent phosphotriesterase family hydrolase